MLLSKYSVRSNKKSLKNQEGRGLLRIGIRTPLSIGIRTPLSIGIRTPLSQIPLLGPHLF